MNHNLFSERVRKYSYYLVAYIAISLLLSIFIGCSGAVKANLGEEFSLHVGESITITGENLEIRFIEVSEDSRCPKGVTCIWAGRVTAVVEISRDGSSQQLTLTEPGLTDAPARQTYEGCELTHRIEPYPEEGKEIAAHQYQLLLTVSK